MDVKELISRIEYNNGSFPEKDIKQLIENKEAAVPELLSIMEYTRDNIDKVSSDDKYFAHIYATFLLAQFKEYKLYKIMYDILISPGELVYDIYGDTITESMGRILASICNSDISLIKQLIENSNIDEYIRSSSIEALIILVSSGKLERDEIIEYFRSLYKNKLERKYSYVWNSLIIGTYNLYPEELMDEVKKSYDDDLVDEQCIEISEFEDQLKLEKRAVLKKLENDKRKMFIENTVEELKWWACFKSYKEESYKYQAKIGRNDPCPCGSGKKYKKCCMN